MLSSDVIEYGHFISIGLKLFHIYQNMLKLSLVHVIPVLHEHDIEYKKKKNQNPISIWFKQWHSICRFVFQNSNDLIIFNTGIAKKSDWLFKLILIMFLDICWAVIYKWQGWILTLRTGWSRVRPSIAACSTPSTVVNARKWIYNILNEDLTALYQWGWANKYTKD